MATDQSTFELLERLAARVEALQSSLRPPEFYSIKQAAEVLGVSADHIRRAVVGGVLAKPKSSARWPGRPYRIARN